MKKKEEQEKVINYPALFSPGYIGNLKIKNRLVMPAMCVGLADENGMVTDALRTFYAVRADGGAGLIITEFTMVNDADGRHVKYQLGAFDDKQIPGLKGLAETVHKYGTKIFVQLCHPGNQAFHPNPGSVALTPSGKESNILKNPCREMTAEEIKTVVKQFAEAAERVKKSGIDGIEINASEGYLLNEFLSPYTNKRTDEYGGNLMNRARICAEIITAVREKVGADYPVIFRMSVDEYLDRIGVKEAYLDLTDSIAILNHLIPMGLDAVSVTSGIYETENTVCEPVSYPQGWRTYLSETIKQNVPAPVIGVSVLRDPEYVDGLIKRGALDFAGVARGQLADPEWGKKAWEGRSNEIRRCISCLHCIEKLASEGRVECAINSRSNHEYDFGRIKEASKGETVVVVGGGPAGMECARVLALCGFKPVLFEKADRLGGQLHIADKPPFKSKIDWLIYYYEERLKALNVDIRLGVTATPELIKAEKPIKVFLATGSVPNMPASIVGLNGPNVFHANDVLTGKVKLVGKQVIVVGDGQTGIETAEKLCMDENVVSIVGRGREIAERIYFQNRNSVLRQVINLHGRLCPHKNLVAINPKGITVQDTLTDEFSFMPTNAVVVALGVHPNTDGRDAILAEYPDAVLVGDAIHGGRIADACHTAYQAVDALVREKLESARY